MNAMSHKCEHPYATFGRMLREERLRQAIVAPQWGGATPRPLSRAEMTRRLSAEGYATSLTSYGAVERGQRLPTDMGAFLNVFARTLGLDAARKDALRRQGGMEIVRREMGDQWIAMVFDAA